jgi:hypothetical protein
MTIKEAILKTLEDNKKLMHYKEIYDYIVKNNLIEFQGATPEATISAMLGNFIRKKDNRINRVEINKNGYFYYLSKYENLLNFQGKKELEDNKNIKERDLHQLFVTYLKSKNIL